MPAVALLAVEGGVGGLPKGGALGLPDGLGAGAREDDVAEAFELGAAAAVQECVIVHGVSSVRRARRARAAAASAFLMEGPSPSALRPTHSALTRKRGACRGPALPKTR